MKDTERRLTRVVAATSGILAAALLPAGVAFADNYVFTPDITTFIPTQVEGYPPLVDVVTGAEDFSFFDTTSSSIFDLDALHGIDTDTSIGSFINDDFLDTGGFVGFVRGTSEVDIPTGTQIDVANFGGGWENVWVDIPASAPVDPGASDLLVTPFGDFTLFGSFFTDLATILS
jgi:hypothetical protein